MFRIHEAPEHVADAVGGAGRPCSLALFYDYVLLTRVTSSPPRSARSARRARAPVTGEIYTAFDAVDKLHRRGPAGRLLDRIREPLDRGQHDRPVAIRSTRIRRCSRTARSTRVTRRCPPLRSTSRFTPTTPPQTRPTSASTSGTCSRATRPRSTAVTVSAARRMATWPTGARARLLRALLLADASRPPHGRRMPAAEYGAAPASGIDASFGCADGFHGFLVGGLYRNWSIAWASSRNGDAYSKCLFSQVLPGLHEYYRPLPSGYNSVSVYTDKKRRGQRELRAGSRHVLRQPLEQPTRTSNLGSKT